jgi:hypothetical protein
VKVDENKITAMVAWPRPTNISELCGFLGLTGYYRKFVKNYSIVARALNNLFKKSQFGGMRTLKLPSSRSNRQ